MIRKFLSKYILEVIPSIVATVVGAYIVTHYVNSKPEGDKPKAAVQSPVATTGDDSNNAPPSAGKQAVEKTVPDKIEKSEKAEKSDKGDRLDTAVEPRRQPLPVRDKAAKSAPPAEPLAAAKSKEDDPRDANEIARAAIERLRSAEPRRVEPPRAAELSPEPPRQEPFRQERSRPTPVVHAAPVPPLVSQPQAVTVTPAPSEVTIGTAPAPFPAPLPPQTAARADDPSRPTPPADIPARPLDLRAKDRTSVAEEVVSTAKDVVSSAKSVFQAVIPGTN